MISALATFVVEFNYVIPYFYGSASNPHFYNYSYLGGSLVEIAGNVLAHPLRTARLLLFEHDGLKYLVKMACPYGFLGFLAPEILALGLPDFLMTFLSKHPHQHNIYFQYHSVGIVIATVAAVSGAARLSVRLPAETHRWVAVGLVGLAVVTAAGLGPFWKVDRFSLRRFRMSERSRALAAVVRRIPGDAVVSADWYVASHLSHRERIYVYPNPFRREGWTGVASDPDFGRYTGGSEAYFDLSRGEEVEYVIIDPTERRVPDDLLTALMAQKLYSRMYQDDYVWLLRRARPPKAARAD